MNFRTQANRSVVGNGAIVLLDGTEVELVNLLVRLSDRQNGTRPAEQITDEERGHMLGEALVRFVQELTGKRQGSPAPAEA